VNLTRLQIAAIRHLADCARFACDPNGTPLLDPGFVGITEEALLLVDRLLADVEAENVRRETSRAPIVSGSMR
jgi:hypothetical protein